MSRLDENERIKALLTRIKKSPDGKDFIDFLSELSNDNYHSWKASDPEMDQFHKGYAFAVDTLLDNFKECDHKAPKEDVGDFT
jgi:hypothetical protein